MMVAQDKHEPDDELFHENLRACGDASIPCC
jgi:hypothetical protein